MKATSKWLAFVLFALMFVALMPMAVRPAAAADPDWTDWIPDQMVSDDLSYNDGRPSIATGKNNELYVAYEHSNPNTTYNEIKVAKSTDGGTTWSVIHTKSTSYNLFRPSIAVDPYYNYIYVVYERRYTASDWDIWLEKYNGTWYTIMVDNSGGTNDRVPSIVAEHDWYSTNYVFVVYERQVSSTDYDLRFAKSTNHGSTWILSTLRDTTDLVHDASIAYARKDRIYVAYRHGTLTLGHIDVSTSFDGGSTWTHKDNISGLPNDCSQPSVTAAHGLGQAVVAYTYASTATNDDIYYHYTTDWGATWSGDRLASTTADERFPHLTVDGQGRTDDYAGYFHVTYLKEETVGSRINGVYYSKLNVGNLYTWSYPVQIADDSAKISFTYWPKLEDRAITTVRNTVPVVVWTDYRGGDTDVYATTLGGKYTIDTSPSGLKVYVDGVDYWAPVSFWWAYGSFHTLAAWPQGTYNFVSWSDGGAQSHQVSTNVVDVTTIIAYFTPTLTLSLSPTTVARGSLLTISGQLTPGLATTVSIYYRMHGTYTWTLGTPIPTNAAGAYSRTATVPMSAPTGTLDLVAAWYDSTNNRYAVSEIKQLIITP